MPAFCRVANAPFLVTVFKARALNFTVTKRESSGTQRRFFFRFGVNVLGVFAVTWRPTPPFFFAMPRRWLTLPRLTPAPVMLQIFDIEQLRLPAIPPRSSDLFGDLLLRGDQPGDALPAHLQQGAEFGVRESGLFARALDFDELAVLGQDDVEVDARAPVFLVIEIEQRDAPDDARADGGDVFLHRKPRQDFGCHERFARKHHRHAGAGYRGRPRAAVGLEDIAIHPHRARAEQVEIDDRAQGTPDEPLDFHRAPVQFPPGDVALFSGLR